MPSIVAQAPSDAWICPAHLCAPTLFPGGQSRGTPEIRLPEARNKSIGPPLPVFLRQDIVVVHAFVDAEGRITNDSHISAPCWRGVSLGSRVLRTKAVVAAAGPVTTALRLMIPRLPSRHAPEHPGDGQASHSLRTQPAVPEDSPGQVLGDELNTRSVPLAAAVSGKAAASSSEALEARTSPVEFALLCLASSPNQLRSPVAHQGLLTCVGAWTCQDPSPSR